jgi:alkylhydroperoxidase family enzyme
MTSRLGISARLEELRERVTEGPGELSRSTRRAAATGQPVPGAAQAYTDKVRRHAYKVTDRDVEDLKAAGWSEDEIFELTIAIAMGEGLSRVEHARRVIGEVRH